MTEAEWLACRDPTPMLVLAHATASERKLGLFACACCRRIWHLLPDERSRRAVETAERYADGRATPLERDAAAEAAAAVDELERGEPGDESDNTGHFRRPSRAAYNAAVWWGGEPAFMAPLAIARDAVIEQRNSGKPASHGVPVGLSMRICRRRLARGGQPES